MEQEEWPGMSLNKIVAPSSCRQLYNFPIFDSLPSLSSLRPTPARSLLSFAASLSLKPCYVF